MKRLRSRLFSPLVQVLLALAGMYAGAWLVGRVAFGLTVLFSGLVLLLDGLFRNPGVPNDARELTAHQEVLERYRRVP